MFAPTSRWRFGYITIILLCTMRLAHSQSLDESLAIVEQVVADATIPGAAVLVLRDGEILAASAFGVCDQQPRREFQLDTICWIASLTKPITATAAMVLVDEGKLSLDDKIASYLPYFAAGSPGDGRELITVRQLMCHASGVTSSVPQRPQFFFTQSWYDKSLEDVVRSIADQPLDFQPGTDVHYSNAAPYVLGRIIEVQSSRPYADFVQERILNPLGMTDTGFSIAENKVTRAAVVYRRQGDQLLTYCRYDPDWTVRMAMPDGGLFSTPRDIGRFANAFLRREVDILSDRAMDEMLTEQSSGFGLGWILDAEGQFSHWGSSGTLVWADRKTKVVGILFTQIQDYERIAQLHRRFRESVTHQTGG